MGEERVLGTVLETRAYSMYHIFWWISALIIVPVTDQNCCAAGQEAALLTEGQGLHTKCLVFHIPTIPTQLLK